MRSTTATRQALQMPTDADQKHLRILCWEALREDNPKQLFKAIDQGVAMLGIDETELMLKFENWLWKKSKWHGRSNGEGQDDPPRGMIAVAAGNQQGVPPPGAIKCLAALLRRFPADYSTDQHAVSLRRAERKERLWVLALLRAWKQIMSRCHSSFLSRMHSPSGWQGSRS